MAEGFSELAGLAPYMTVRTEDDVDRHLERVRRSAERARHGFAAHQGDGLDLIRRVKFEAAGFHPVEGRALNFIEQVNQTWTYVVALLAARQLLQLHPEAGGFRLAPGAHAALELDVMSEVEGLVGAETFAAVRPSNNGKLAADLRKLAARPEAHRYVFMMCPGHPGTRRIAKLERGGVQVWSVDLP